MGKPARNKKNLVSEVSFFPNPTQELFIRSMSDADLFASRVGEGKTAALCWASMYHTQHNPGARHAIIRDTWENMWRTTQKEFFKWFPPGVFGRYSESKKTFTWTAGQVGLEGEVLFLGLEDPGDAAKLQSLELAALFMDEPAPAAESGGIDEMIFDIGMTRLRQPDMKWYAAKLAENNPDETHWTYRRFVAPGTPGFKCWQTKLPENNRNLPDGYYQKLADQWAHRPDLKRRFLEGKFGFQQIGKQVTPEWNDDLHLARSLDPVEGCELILLWDGGSTPTCVITQITPLGQWLALEAYVGDGIGAYELIGDVVRPRLTTRFRGFRWSHIGDPNMESREQSRSHMNGRVNSAANVIRKELGGTFKGGPIDIPSGLEPLRARMRLVTPEGVGYILVDAQRAKPVWHALRGGWHRQVQRTGLVGEIVKNDHSHPGDCMRYGAGVLFPRGSVQQKQGAKRGKSASYFGRQQSGLGFERPGLRLPRDMIPVNKP